MSSIERILRMRCAFVVFFGMRVPRESMKSIKFLTVSFRMSPLATNQPINEKSFMPRRRMKLVPHLSDNEGSAR